ncbi:RNA polymerase II transcription mediator complex subunit 9-domain-containing protein [Terfezia claveryi]|nr:RNA polymerase II transcription mediator complex subunit 9-domain-containing protein [Terfezia claveryi]
MKAKRKKVLKAFGQLTRPHTSTRLLLLQPHHLDLHPTIHSPISPLHPRYSSAPIHTPTPSPPNTFDFLPPLHSLINKVHADELPPQDLSHQANPIRVKLAKARQLVLDLPDMSRSIGEQKEEIRELEERIEKQRRVIREALEVVRREIGKGWLGAGVDGNEQALVQMEVE